MMVVVAKPKVKHKSFSFQIYQYTLPQISMYLNLDQSQKDLEQFLSDV